MASGKVSGKGGPSAWGAEHGLGLQQHGRNMEKHKKIKQAVGFGRKSRRGTQVTAVHQVCCGGRQAKVTAKTTKKVPKYEKPWLETSGCQGGGTTGGGANKKSSHEKVKGRLAERKKKKGSRFPGLKRPPKNPNKGEGTRYQNPRKKKLQDTHKSAGTKTRVGPETYCHQTRGGKHCGFQGEKKAKVIH